MKTKLATAIAFSSDKHKNQFDKGGMPYILHPLKVMYYVSSFKDFELMMGAVLHDIKEDCGVTDEMLREIGMTERVILMVDALTKKKGQSAEEYLEGIKANHDAIRIKLADLRHNMDPKRLKGVSDKDIARMTKYTHMFYDLTKALS